MKLVPGFMLRRLAHRPNLVKILDNIGWLFVDKALRLAVGLFVGAWIARYLGPEQFGLLSFAMALVGLFGAIATLGMQGIVVRDIVRDPAGKEETLGTAAALQFTGGAVAYALLLGTILWLRPDDALAKAMVAIAGALLLFKGSEVARYWFESQVLSKYTVWVENSVFLTFAVVKVVLILQSAPLVAFAWATMIEALVLAVSMLALIGRRGPLVQRLRIEAARARELLRDSWPLAVTGLLVAINLKVDQIMIGQMLGNAETGIYAVASNLIQISIGVFLIVEQSLYPSNIAASKNGHSSLVNSLVRAYSLSFYGALFISVLFAIFGKSILVLLYGDAYAESAVVLWILLALLPISALVRNQSQYCQITGKTRLVMYRQALIVVINASLNLLLIPLYGVAGSAVAIVVAFVTALFVIALMERDFAVIPKRIVFYPYSVWSKLNTR